MDLLKEHKVHKGMYYYRTNNKRWSKDFYNYTRASWYGNIDTQGPVQVGQLPHGQRRI